MEQIISCFSPKPPFKNGTLTFPELTHIIHSILRANYVIDMHISSTGIKENNNHRNDLDYNNVSFLILQVYKWATYHI